MMRATRARHGALLLCIALRAQAQAQAQTPTQAPADPAPSAGGPAASSAPTSEPGAPDPLDQAASAFKRGEELFASGDYQGALDEYERAYEWMPVYPVLFNIGKTNYLLNRPAAARRALADYLEMGGDDISPERARQVRETLAQLAKKTATLSLLLNVPDALVHIDGQRVAPTEISGIFVEPGRHVVSVTKPGFNPVQQVLDAPTGENLRVVLPPLSRLTTLGPPAPIARGALTIVPDTSPAPPVIEETTPLWVPWTLTGVLAAGWLTTAGLAIQARHDRDVIEQPGTPQHRIDSARRLHMSLAIASDVLLAATLVSGGISAYMTWWPSDDAASGAGLGPLPLGGLAAGVSGHF